MKQTAFLREKNGECAACLKYSVRIFVDKIYNIERLEVSCAVRDIYIYIYIYDISRLRVKVNDFRSHRFALLKMMKH
jgi:hypothetical protein